MAGFATRATGALDRVGAKYRVHEYEVREKVGDGYGSAVAEAIGIPDARVFKTLVVTVDDEQLVGLVPVDRRLSTKKLARAAGGKHCSLADPATAERVTGYVTGGISPFGQRQRLRLFLDSSALEHETIAVSGGRRGIQLELSPGVLLEVAGGIAAPIAD
jgi:Cys-tRNA(Pro)/Cys-tRNA(Cys) deacylase